ncbi:hypothetical protein BO70DRAFT_34138 [Aspergillus heteromorphus CBS 117.55]|uniref:Serine-rich protein n=1 Tax=Aspergillus heteromorphus CBS 117.55 TaxID=1448321 RepID=A0A317WFK8_9EURO|nr:uncharacterized protein BO70DRAFT_34138 [Aspergillus heteromorphus CBS 117.55]PWY83030.1 hypothetical protein BO70DRAFT_34138 [Aspergillus heteromorphus CBS 117.55]
MRSTAPSSSSPKRRALHERSPSHTNEDSPPSSLRAVSDKYHHNTDPEPHDVYSATPYPTKPEQILLPRPGKGQDFIPDSRFHVDEAPDLYAGNTSTELSHIADSSMIDRSVSDPWDLSSTFDAANTPSQVWEDDPSSSKSSFPEPMLPDHKPTDHKSDEGSDVAYSDEEPNTLPLPKAAPTIKTVVSQPPSRNPSGPETLASSNSSPNVVPIGPPSSPNFVALDSSSLNFVPLGASSNPGSLTRSNSLSSLNSLGTVIRYIGAAQWTHGSSSEQSSSSRSRSQSVRSNPPYQVPSVRSNSLQARDRSHSGSVSTSSRSGPSSDIQAIVDSGVFIQYPTIRAPSSSSSRVDVSNHGDASDPPPPEPTADYASDRFKSHLSTVTSRWSAECDSRSISPAADSIDNSLGHPRRPSPALARQHRTSSSMWLVTDSDNDEQMDNISSLPARPSNPAVPSSLSSESRKSSMRSNMRPPTSGSFSFNILPNWARVYYQSHDQAEDPAVPGTDAGRPSSARPTTSHTTHTNPLHRLPTAMSRSRTRTMGSEMRESVRWKPDPRDPRSHWARDPEAERRETSRHRLRQSWSPHLFPDRRVNGPRAGTWGAPSLDSRMEPLFGRRNIQVWSFCVGFVFPLAWLIASFLPLPNQPDMTLAEGDVENQLEMTLRMRLRDLERKRYENARWWRNLNRWMNPLGLVIITIVITLAVVGTTVGF